MMTIYTRSLLEEIPERIKRDPIEKIHWCLEWREGVWIDRNRLSTGTREETSNYGSTIALVGNGYRLVLLTFWVYLLNSLTLSLTGRHSILGDGCSAVPSSEVDCLCLSLYRLVGNSWKVTETPIGLGLSHSYVLLLISEGLTNWWTLRYELGTLGLLGCWHL
jgi:hypothetical protein